MGVAEGESATYVDIIEDISHYFLNILLGGSLTVKN